MRNRITLLLLAALPLLFAPGCSGKKPDDWPTVYPVKVTATKDGAPLADLQVFFKPTSGTMTYAVAGTTNSSGTAVMETRGNTYTEKGVPAGEYAVTFAANLQPTRTVDAAYDLPLEERRAYLDALAEENAQLRASNPVPSGLSGGSTELVITVGEGGVEQTVEFSEFSDDGSTREVQESETSGHP